MRTRKKRKIGRNFKKTRLTKGTKKREREKRE